MTLLLFSFLESVGKRKYNPLVGNRDLGSTLSCEMLYITLNLFKVTFILFVKIIRLKYNSQVNGACFENT